MSSPVVTNNNILVKQNATNTGDYGVFKPGGTKYHLRAWLDLTHDPFVIKSIQGVEVDLEEEPLQEAVPREFEMSVENEINLTVVVAEHLNKGIIERCTSCKGEFLSNIFLRPKPNGKHRLILDLSDLNDSVTYRHFKMESLQTAIDMVQQGCYMGSLDLSDAYYSIPVVEGDRKLLRFNWRGELYQFTCLPNGLAQAPRTFTKVLRPVFATLQEQGHSCFGYIDDTFIMGETYKQCSETIRLLQQQLVLLGFKIHEKKSVVIPTTKITFLGYEVDTLDMKVRPTPEKIQKFKDLAWEILESEKIRIRDVARLIGLMVDYSKGIDYGEAHYRRLESEKTLALKNCQGNFERKMTLTDVAKEDIYWWLERIDTGCRKIRLQKPVLTVVTDSSDNGWGAVCGEERTRGLWSLQERELHTNIKETKAVLLGLQVYVKKYRHETIRCLTDNTTAVAYVNHKGGSKNEPCDDIAKDIWEFCERRDLWVIAAHIPGKENVEADEESRAQGHTEWELPDETFQCIVTRWGQPTVDLFASRLAHKLDTYYSWHPDPGAEAIDALSIPWPNDYYAFPPFSLNLRVAQKALAEGVQGTLLTPRWAAQPWYGLLKRRAKDYVRLPGTTLQNPVTGDLWQVDLVAWRI